MSFVLRCMQTSARALILSRPAVFATLLAAFGLVIASGVLAAFSTHQVAAADRRAAHAQQTLVTLNGLLATMNEAETAQRGFLLTHDDKYLAPYEAARPRYRQELAALARQFDQDLVARRGLEELTRLCDARFAEIERTVNLRREHGIAPALNVIESDEGWRVMQQVREKLTALQREELSGIAQLTATAAHQARTYELLHMALLAVAAALAGTVAWMLARRLHQLEGLIKVCAWTHRVQWEGKWIRFEEYLARRFNLQCTHGISDEAARQMREEIEKTPIDADPELKG